MKNLIFLLCTFCTLTVFSQSTEFELKKVKIIDRIDGEWEDWPDDYFVFEEHNQENSYFTITKSISESHTYTISLTINEEQTVTFDVVYDEELSIEKMKTWDSAVYCYRDKTNNDDKVIIDHVSLDQLVEYPYLWTSMQSRQFYLIAISANKSLVYK